MAARVVQVAQHDHQAAARQRRGQLGDARGRASSARRSGSAAAVQPLQHLRRDRLGSTREVPPADADHARPG